MAEVQLELPFEPVPTRDVNVIWPAEFKHPPEAPMAREHFSVKPHGAIELMNMVCGQMDELSVSDEMIVIARSQYGKTITWTTLQARANAVDMLGALALAERGLLDDADESRDEVYYD